MSSRQVKVVLHCQVDGDIYTSQGKGGIKGWLEEKFGEDIVYRPFSGHLVGTNLSQFLAECQDADLVVTDAWTHPENNLISTKEAQEKMADVLRQVQKINPEAVLFAELMEGVHEVAAHRIAQAHTCYRDDCIIGAMEQVRAWKSRDDADQLPVILVVDDSPANLQAARDQFMGCRLITETLYLSAITILENHSVDVVLTDLMMPCESANQGPEGKKFVGQEAPMGAFVALKAIEVGVEKVFVVSDTNHHDHPAGHVAEQLSSSGSIKWFCGYSCKLTTGPHDSTVKDWAGILDS